MTLNKCTGYGLERAMHFHLTWRISPPRPGMFDCAMQAVAACNGGEPERMIDLPPGFTHREYGKTAPAESFVQGLNLWCFLDQI